MAENQKKARKQTPPKIQYYLLGGVFSPAYDMYTLVYTIHDVYHASEWYMLAVLACQMYRIK